MKKAIKPKDEPVLYFHGKNFSLGSKEENGVFIIKIADGSKEYIAKARSKKAKDEYEKWYWGSFNTDKRRKAKADLDYTLKQRALRKLGVLLSNPLKFETSVPIERIELQKLKTEFERLPSYSEKLNWWKKQKFEVEFFQTIFLTDFPSENEKPENRFSIFPITNEEVRLYNEFCFNEYTNGNYVPCNISLKIAKFYDGVKNGGNAIEFAKREIQDIDENYGNIIAANKKIGNTKTSAIYSFFADGYDASIKGTIDKLFGSKLMINQMYSVAQGYTAERYKRFLNTELQKLSEPPPAKPNVPDPIEHFTKLISAFDTLLINCGVHKRDVVKSAMTFSGGRVNKEDVVADMIKVINMRCREFRDNEVWRNIWWAKKEINNLKDRSSPLLEDVVMETEKLEGILRNAIDENNLNHVDIMPKCVIFFNTFQQFWNFVNWMYERKLFKANGNKVAASDNKKEATIEIIPSKSTKLKDELTKVGFFEMDYTKTLTDTQKDKLIQLINDKELPYKIALLDYIGFIDYLHKQHYTLRQDLYKRLAEILSVTERGVKGNILVLVKKSKEDKKRYTAYKHKEKVKKDYQNIKSGVLPPVAPQ